MHESWTKDPGPVISLAGNNMLRTDSGGQQDETTALGASHQTMRENTKRPIAVDQDTNSMIGCNIAAIRHHTVETLIGTSKNGRIPELWNGHAAERTLGDPADRLFAHHSDSANGLAIDRCQSSQH